ncbi:hypothetical protein PRIPAC_95525 [Pristionchus pacificus]|uniref:Uncharacterized protein n=1 Tax=Pristionchus pacificus TaxID=54126 RepID=A0A2A6D2A6_PRIPA|nr:hypothetical protein PRIPAC_95525 [Pristionchus pacificus]|eukprot:PDM84545.1 hypothetical protein PRIPAC_33568 [Pristionchus pacificus]
MAMYHRPIRLFPDGPEHNEPIASDDEGIVFHVPLRSERQCALISTTHSNEACIEVGQQLMKVSFLYAILVVGYLIVEETTYEEKNGDVGQIFPPGSAFHYYMYIVGIGYIVYANLFIIHTSWLNWLFRYLADKRWWKNANKHLITSVPHKSYTVTSLYLRIGTALFGCGGIVLYGLNIFLLFSNRITTHHKNPSVAENIFGATFTFLQTYFMAVNKQSIESSSNFCRFGLMHNFSLNLWIWHRYSTAKQLDHEAKNHSTAKDVTVFKFPGEYHEIIDVLEYYGAFAGLLDTFLVEYSVVGAAVMFVHWRHLDGPIKPSERPQLQRTNFSHTFAGICFAVVIFVLGAVVCGVYSAVAKDAKDADAYLLLGIYESVCYVCCFVAVLSAMIFMRSHVLAHSDEAEDVDRILLYIVFVGELIWCSADLARFIDGQDGGKTTLVHLCRNSSPIGACLLTDLVHSHRIEVITLLHTPPISVHGRLVLPPSSNHVSLRGRQCVTFLIINNLTLFFFHIYSSITAGRYDIPLAENHMKLLSEPLITFYRFHSTVSLTKIWTKSFALPNMNNVHYNE